MNKIDFKTSGYFPILILITGAFLLIIGLPVLIFLSILGGAALCFIGLVVVSTHYRLRVDYSTKTYHDYLWILGIRHGEKGRFNKVEYLFIRKGHITQKMNSRVYSTTIRKQVFDGYLKFSEENKIHIVSMENKNELTKRLKRIAEQLKTKVVDYSQGPPIEI